MVAVGGGIAADRFRERRRGPKLASVAAQPAVSSRFSGGSAPTSSRTLTGVLVDPAKLPAFAGSLLPTRSAGPILVKQTPSVGSRTAVSTAAAVTSGIGGRTALQTSPIARTLAQRPPVKAAPRTGKAPTRPPSKKPKTQDKRKGVKPKIGDHRQAVF